MDEKEPKNKYLCIKWLEWFKDFVAAHHVLTISNEVLANTTREFEYDFLTVQGDTGEMGFDSRFVFKFKGNDRVVTVPFVRIRSAEISTFYDTVLSTLTRYIIYGKEFMGVANILCGNAVINWQAPKGEQYTLKDLIKHGDK